MWSLYAPGPNLAEVGFEAPQPHNCSSPSARSSARLSHCTQPALQQRGGLRLFSLPACCWGGWKPAAARGCPCPPTGGCRCLGSPAKTAVVLRHRTPCGVHGPVVCPRCSGFPARYTLPVSHVFLLIYCLIYSWSTCRRALWKAASRLHRFICLEPAV